MFHRCVITVIGVLAVSASATAGPIKLGEQGPSLDVAELRASGVRMGQQELRALFFRGGQSRNAAASCGDCLVAESSLSARERNGKSASDYESLFPFSAGNLFRAPGSASPSRPAATAAAAAAAPAPLAVPDLLTGPAAVVTEAALVVAAAPLSSSADAAPMAVVAAASPVPEPSTVALIGSGLAAAWLVRRRRGHNPVA